MVKWALHAKGSCVLLLYLSANARLWRKTHTHTLTFFMWLWPACWRWTSAISTPLRGASKASRSCYLLHQSIRFSQIIFCLLKLATNVDVWTENAWGLGGIKTIQNTPRAAESTARWGKQFICIWWLWHVQYVGLSHDSSLRWEASKMVFDYIKLPNVFLFSFS